MCACKIYVEISAVDISYINISNTPKLDTAAQMRQMCNYQYIGRSGSGVGLDGTIIMSTSKYHNTTIPHCNTTIPHLPYSLQTCTISKTQQLPIAGQSGVHLHEVSRTVLGWFCTITALGNWVNVPPGDIASYLPLIR